MLSGLVSVPGEEIAQHFVHVKFVVLFLSIRLKFVEDVNIYRTEIIFKIRYAYVRHSEDCRSHNSPMPCVMCSENAKSTAHRSLCL